MSSAGASLSWLSHSGSSSREGSIRVPDVFPFLFGGLFSRGTLATKKRGEKGHLAGGPCAKLPMCKWIRTMLAVKRVDTDFVLVRPAICRERSYRICAPHGRVMGKKQMIRYKVCHSGAWLPEL